LIQQKTQYYSRGSVRPSKPNRKKSSFVRDAQTRSLRRLHWMRFGWQPKRTG